MKRLRDNAAAALLLLFTVAAILWANSPWGSGYFEFWSTPIGLSFGDLHAELTLREFVNDGLMTFFFFVVGLEVKAQFTIGELTERSRAAVPVLAAIAGLILPALIFLLFNPSGDDARAWGVVISTDTAFLIGALAIIAPKYPARLRTFLLTLAVVDDIGALLAIALFYSEHINPIPLAIAAGLLIALVLVRYLPSLARGPAYSLLALGLWLALHAGGVHATLAGVAVALVVPVFTPERQRVEAAVDVIRAFRQSPNSEYARAATRSLRESISINERLLTSFGPYISFGILPIFALANAGVRLDADTLVEAVRSPLTWGVIVGLVAGKLIGITGATWLVRRLGMGRLAPGLTLRRVAGGAAVSGIGFTIALFIVDVAIKDPRSADLARVGVLAASVIAFAAGWATFRITDWLTPPVPVGLKLVRPIDPDRDHIRGRAEAPLTLVEYGDFECPFCSRATGSIDDVRAHFGDELCYVWRHFPMEKVHPRAMDAAHASEAAAVQGKFFDMAAKMFEFQDYLEWEHIYRYADQVGCDIAKFDEDLHSPHVLLRVEDDAQDAELMDLGGTPTFFVNGIRHNGPWDAASLIRALEAGRS